MHWSYWCSMCGWQLLTGINIRPSKTFEAAPKSTYFCLGCGREFDSDAQPRSATADLAMALELAGLIHAEVGSDYWWDNGADGFCKVADWLRAQVITALYEGDR